MGSLMEAKVMFVEEEVIIDREVKRKNRLWF